MPRFVIAMVLMLAATAATYAQDIKVVGEDIRVPYGDGEQIFVRNKRPEGVQTFKSDRIAIMMHGATYPGVSTFDLPVAGKSWMDYMAERGFDVYALDLPGYGRSTRPAAMDLPADQNPPLMRGTEAVKAIGAVVDHVLKRRGVEKVNLIGHSWGTTLCATYTTENQAKVERLVLYAPVWLRATPSPHQVQAKLGAYRVVTREQTLARWLSGVPEDKKASLNSGRLVRHVGQCNICHGSQGRRQDFARAERCGAGRPRIFWRHAAEGILGTHEDHLTCAPRSCRVGSRYAALYGADALSLARQCGLEAPCGAE